MNPENHNRIIIYPTYSKVTIVVTNTNLPVNVTEADIKSIFVIDSNGKYVPFKYNPRTSDDLLYFKHKDVKKNVTVTKGNQTYQGFLYKHDSNSITIHNSGKMTTIYNYDTISSTITNIKEESVIRFQNVDDEFALPFYVQYITYQTSWSCEGIGLIKNSELDDKSSCPSCYDTNIDIILRANIENKAVSGNFDVHLGFSNYEPKKGFEFYQNNFESKSVRSVSHSPQYQTENDYYTHHIGLKNLIQKLNIFEFMNISLRAMKSYFHFIGDNITYVGYIIEKIDNLPPCHIQFYDFKNNSIGKVYGNITLSRLSNVKNVKLIFDTRSVSVKSNSHIDYVRGQDMVIKKENIKLSCENKNENDILLTVLHNLQGAITSKNISFSIPMPPNAFTIEDLTTLKFVYIFPPKKLIEFNIAITY